MILFIRYGERFAAREGGGGSGKPQTGQNLLSQGKQMKIADEVLEAQLLSAGSRVVNAPERTESLELKAFRAVKAPMIRRTPSGDIFEAQGEVVDLASRKFVDSNFQNNLAFGVKMTMSGTLAAQLLSADSRLIFAQESLERPALKASRAARGLAIRLTFIWKVLHSARRRIWTTTKPIAAAAATPANPTNPSIPAVPTPTNFWVP